MEISQQNKMSPPPFWYLSPRISTELNSGRYTTMDSASEIADEDNDSMKACTYDDDAEIIDEACDEDVVQIADKDSEEEVGDDGYDWESSDSSSDDNMEESDFLVESERSCDICCKIFKSLEYFEIHQRLHRQGKFDRVIQEPELVKKESEQPFLSSSENIVKIQVEKENSASSACKEARNLVHKNDTASSLAPKPSTSGNSFQKQRSKLRDNVDDLLVEGPRVCKFCGKTFYSMDYYRIHQRVHVSEKLKHIPVRPSARLSSHYSGGKQQLATSEGHQVISVYPQVGVLNVSESSTNYTKMPTTKKCCICDVCSLTFPNYRSLTLHKKVHRKGLCTVYPLYICSVCNRGFVSKSSFLNHCAFHGAKPWTCNMCGMTFSKKMYLGMHKSSKHHHKERVEVKCLECNSTFEKEMDMRRHMRMHESRRQKFLRISCNCTLCGKMLPLMTTNELRVHMGVHFGEVLKCHICPNIFYESQEFKEHMDKHLGL